VRLRSLLAAHVAFGVAASALSLAVACSNPRPARAPTYHDDIAPLLERSCVGCHDGSGAHVALTSYAAVATHAELALALIEAGLMPKGNIDSSGACGRFAGHAPVEEADIELLAAFIEHGMPEGEPRARLPAAPAAAFAPGAELALPEPYRPAADGSGGSGDHRCFVLAGAELAAASLAAFRVVPTLPEVVHHAMLFALDAEPDAQAARALDQQAAGPGWPCFGPPGIAGARLVGVWTPGNDVVRFPDGFATRLGRMGLVAQIHYDGPPAPRVDQTRFELELGASSLRELRLLPFAAVDLSLPPGQASVRSAHRGWLELPDDGLILGVYPHMHALGRSLSLRARAGGAETCLVDAPRWDYTWQELAFYEQPLRFAEDPELVLECEHSTLGVERTVRWGERMEDEMCMAFVATAQ
jgi:Copper type II ascorbate-dependent monooxygenase, C-terminal domain